MHQMDAKLGFAQASMLVCFDLRAPPFADTIQVNYYVAIVLVHFFSVKMSGKFLSNSFIG